MRERHREREIERVRGWGVGRLLLKQRYAKDQCQPFKLTAKEKHHPVLKKLSWMSTSCTWSRNYEHYQVTVTHSHRPPVCNVCA